MHGTYRDALHTLPGAGIPKVTIEPLEYILLWSLNVRWNDSQLIAGTSDDRSL